MFSRELINPQRRRCITGSFSWIDHRLLSDDYLKQMSRDEILLYFFYVLVGDSNGISFYHYQTICGLLKINSCNFAAAQAALIARSLIVYQDRRVQVLQLPRSPHKEVNDTDSEPQGYKSLEEILSAPDRSGK